MPSSDHDFVPVRHAGEGPRGSRPEGHPARDGEGALSMRAVTSKSGRDPPGHSRGTHSRKQAVTAGHLRTQRLRALSSGGQSRTPEDTCGHTTNTVRDREAPAFRIPRPSTKPRAVHFKRRGSPKPEQTLDSAIALGLLAAMDNHSSHHVSQGRPSWTADARLWAEPAA